MQYPVFASSSPQKKRDSVRKVNVLHMPSLNNLVIFFVSEKMQFLLLFKEITQLDFQTNLKKENTVTV